MNLSGEAIRDVLRWYKISPKRMLVLYDDMDSPVGVVKLKGKGGHGGHNVCGIARTTGTFAIFPVAIMLLCFKAPVKDIPCAEARRETASNPAL